MQFKNGVYLIWVLTFCCFVIYMLMLVVSISAEAQEPEPVPKLSELGKLAELRHPTPDKQPDHGPGNLVGFCPPQEGDYQCPMVPQETTRIFFKSTLSDSEGEQPIKLKE